jgi:outer membrane protein OmpA-like peptidoglycan-associated protein
VVILADAATAELSTGILVHSRLLAAGLAVLTALAAAGLALAVTGHLPQRLLARMAVRAGEGIFVTGMAVLGYQGARAGHGGTLAAAGEAAMVALASALTLAVTEVAAAKSRDPGMLRVPREGRRHAAGAHLARIQAWSETARDRLLKEFSPGPARLRTPALPEEVIPADGDLSDAPRAGTAACRPRRQAVGGPRHRRTAAIAAGAAATAAAVMAAGILAVLHIPGARPQPAAAGPSYSASYSGTAMVVTTDASPGPGGLRVPLFDPAVEFTPGQYHLSASAEAALRSWASKFKGLITGKITIYGYGDPGGGAANDKLAPKRSKAVAAFLESQGIRAALLSVVSPPREQGSQEYDRHVYIYMPLVVADVPVTASSGTTVTVYVNGSSSSARALYEWIISSSP